MSKAGDSIRDVYAILQAMAQDEDPEGLSRTMLEQSLEDVGAYDLASSLAMTALMFAQIIAHNDDRPVGDLLAEFGMSAAESLAEDDE